jgi:hypothetical protein
LPTPGHQPRLDRLQFAIDRLELARQQAEHLARQCRHPVVARQPPQQLNHLLGSFGHRDAKLRRVAAHRVDQHRTLLDQQIAHPEHPRVKPEDQRRLLLGGFDRHKPHGRPAHRFADRLGIDRVVLAALGVGLDVLRRDQHHLVPQAVQPPCPMMRGAARLDTDARRRQLGEKLSTAPRRSCRRNTGFSFSSTPCS